MRRESAVQDSGGLSAMSVQVALKTPAVAMGHVWMDYSKMGPASARSSTVAMAARTAGMRIILAQTVSQSVTVCTGNAAVALLAMGAARAMEATQAPGVTKSCPFAKV